MAYTSRATVKDVLVVARKKGECDSHMSHASSNKSVSNSVFSYVLH
jgi:hypothetical protein